MVEGSGETDLVLSADIHAICYHYKSTFPDKVLRLEREGKLCDM